LLLGAITERRGEKEKAAVELKQSPEIRCRRGPAVLKTPPPQIEVEDTPGRCDGAARDPLLAAVGWQRAPEMGMPSSASMVADPASAAAAEIPRSYPPAGSRHRRSRRPCSAAEFTREGGRRGRGEG
jgi:hypothetical protein